MWFVGLLAGVGCPLGAKAQVFSADAYYQQCLTFETSGDLDTARRMCLNALELEPGRADVLLALARVELALGRLAAAETHLRQLQGRVQHPEYDLLLAEAALQRGRPDEAARRLEAARSRLGAAAPSTRARLEYLTGAVAEARGDYARAVQAYRAALEHSPSAPYQRLAQLLLRLGRADEAERAVEGLEPEASLRDPSLLAILGRARWAQGELPGAAQALETAVALRGGEEVRAQSNDLLALALIYYAQGDLQAGNLALQDALARGTLLLELLNRASLWLIALILLLGVHLLGEGRAPSTPLTPAETPTLWSIGDVYAVLGVALLAALAAAVVYGVVRYDNALALATPFQAGEARAVYALTLALVASALAAYRIRRQGWEVGERLLGSAERLLGGALLGVLLLVLSVLYLRYAPVYAPWLGTRYYLELLPLRPTVVAAALLTPLGQLFFCAFALPPLHKRYGRTYALIIAGLLFAVVLASPPVLLAVTGWLLADLYLRSHSGLAVVLAATLLDVGLLLGVAFLPFVRVLFF